MTVGNPQQPCRIQGTSSNQTAPLEFLLTLGPAQWKARLSSTAALLAVPAKRIYAERERDWNSFYNRANCLGLPHSAKCWLCYFTTPQEARGQRARTADRDAVIPLFTSIHLKPRLQWETTAFQLFSSSSRRQTPGSKLKLQQFFQSGFVF